ncbi:unnamed protein product [Owenia fusiformis]|uniref:Uncharacterized protein n=1 Tax=Owenia fusiformis TaxID=6347 RepID=A0A8J1TJU7_OWEFU|nr:unnamed protein product [Owenia fusiformis]
MKVTNKINSVKRKKPDTSKDSTLPYGGSPGGWVVTPKPAGRKSSSQGQPGRGSSWTVTPNSVHNAPRFQVASSQGQPGGATVLGDMGLNPYGLQQPRPVTYISNNMFGMQPSYPPPYQHGMLYPQASYIQHQAPIQQSTQPMFQHQPYMSPPGNFVNNNEYLASEQTGSMRPMLDFSSSMSLTISSSL